MTLLEAIILGLVQGLTEFLPISSTAHLRVLPSLLGWKDPGAAASAIIQLGTMIAVVSFFRYDLLRLFTAFFRGIRYGNPQADFEARLAWYIILGTIPIGVAGLVFKNFIETTARSLYLVAGALILFALILALAERTSKFRREIQSLRLLDGIIVGIAQAIALIPGSSRSGTTITAGLFLGLNREAAARFSFLLSVPAVVASGFFELYEIRHSITAVGALSLFVATFASAVVGYGTIAFLLRYLRTHSTFVFVWYRLILGAAVFLLLSRGVILPFS